MCKPRYCGVGCSVRRRERIILMRRVGCRERGLMMATFKIETWEERITGGTVMKIHLNLRLEIDGATLRNAFERLVST